MTIDGILQAYDKATPGEWESRDKVVGSIGQSIDDDIVVCFIPNELFAPKGFANWKANSRLIAGAPKLAAEVRRLRERERVLVEALRFYAGQENWKPDDWGVPSVISTPDYGDPGKTARDALEEVKEYRDV